MFPLPQQEEMDDLRVRRSLLLSGGQRCPRQIRLANKQVAGALPRQGPVCGRPGNRKETSPATKMGGNFPGSLVSMTVP